MTYMDFHSQISYDTSTPMQAGPEWGPTYTAAPWSSTSSPEPENWGMLMAGLVLISWRQRRKQGC